MTESQNPCPHVGLRESNQKRLQTKAVQPTAPSAEEALVHELTSTVWQGLCEAPYTSRLQSTKKHIELLDLRLELWARDPDRPIITQLEGRSKTNCLPHFGPRKQVGAPSEGR